MLKDLLNGKITFSEATAAVKDIKKLQPVRDAFLLEVCMTTWEEAMVQYPSHANDARLKQFVDEDMKSPPKVFLVRTPFFCIKYFVALKICPVKPLGLL